jgi:FkbM family methyltransferase
MTKAGLGHALHKSGLFGVLDWFRDYIELFKAPKRTSFSQNGEDLELRKRFGARQGLYIEIGANHPLRLSNTYLLYRMGWRGMIVEPVQSLYAKHKRLRPRDIHINAAADATDGEVTFYEMIPSVLSTCNSDEAEKAVSGGTARMLRKYPVPVTTVAALYRTHLAPNPVLVLSVDTEGHDLAVLQGVDWVSMRPEVVICEGNDDVRRSEITEFLAGRGYECYKQMGCNLMFSQI